MALGRARIEIVVIRRRAFSRLCVLLVELPRRRRSRFQPPNTDPIIPIPAVRRPKVRLAFPSLHSNVSVTYVTPQKAKPPTTKV